MQRKEIPGLDTTATADISFILLIFFLVATSFNTYKGIDNTLPRDDHEQTDKTEMKARNVMQLTLHADNTITCGEEKISIAQLQQQLPQFISNPDNNPTLPQRYEQYIPLIGKCTSTYDHHIIVNIDRQAHYDTYFQILNAIHNTYDALREQTAQQHFHQHYNKLSAQQQQAVRKIYPMHLTERMEEPTNYSTLPH